MKKLFKKFYTYPNCGNAISKEKRIYFACPNCGKALCRKKDIRKFSDKYCRNCGYDLSSTIKKAIALLKEAEEI